LCSPYAMLCSPYAMLCSPYAMLCSPYAMLCSPYAMLCSPYSGESENKLKFKLSLATSLQHFIVDKTETLQIILSALSMRMLKYL
jgi:hypothetical protein